MCRSIKKLRQPDCISSDEEIYAAALQFVRKVSGYRKPSQANQVAFDDAVAEITASTRKLLENLQLFQNKRGQVHNEHDLGML